MTQKDFVTAGIERFLRKDQWNLMAERQSALCAAEVLTANEGSQVSITDDRWSLSNHKLDLRTRGEILLAGSWLECVQMLVVRRSDFQELDKQGRRAIYKYTRKRRKRRWNSMFGFCAVSRPRKKVTQF